MKICIIGTGGFLANAIIQLFSKEQLELILMGRTRAAVVPDSHFFYLDLLSDPLPFEMLASCDVIIYTAALGVQSGEKISNENVYIVNTFIPVKLCEGLNALKFKGVFISFGSYFEIGSTRELNYFAEEDILHSKADVPNVYCFSKRMLTQYFHFAKFEFINYHFILPTIYGDGENPGRLIPYTCNGFKLDQPLSFTAGTQVRQYLYVDDAAALILTCIKSRIPAGIYNFPSAESLTIKELVKKIGREFGKEVPENSFRQLTRTDAAMQVLQINAGKLLKYISLLPLATIEDYIKRIKN